MKRLIIISMAIIFFIACNKSPKQIMIQNVQEMTKKNLLEQSSYNMTKFDILDTITFSDLMRSVKKINLAIDDLDSLIQLHRNLEVDLSKKGDFLSLIYLNVALEDRQKCTRFTDKFKILRDSINKLTNPYKNDKDIVLYQINHEYEIKSRDGQTTSKKEVLFLDNDYNKSSVGDFIYSNSASVDSVIMISKTMKLNDRLPYFAN